MEDLLLPPDETPMLVLAREGPILAVNGSPLLGRSDAIPIRQGGITTLSLPDFTPQALQSWMAELAAATTGWTPRNFASKNAKMREYLMWM